MLTALSGDKDSQSDGNYSELGAKTDVWFKKCALTSVFLIILPKGVAVKSDIPIMRIHWPSGVNGESQKR